MWRRSAGVLAGWLAGVPRLRPETLRAIELTSAFTWQRDAAMPAGEDASVPFASIHKAVTSTRCGRCITLLRHETTPDRIAPARCLRGSGEGSPAVDRERLHQSDRPR